MGETVERQLRTARSTGPDVEPVARHVRIAQLVVDQHLAARGELVDAVRAQRDRKPADHVRLRRLSEAHRERRTLLLQCQQLHHLSHGRLDLERSETMPIANVGWQCLRSVSAGAVAHQAFERIVRKRQQLLLRAEFAPDFSEHPMQQRAAIDGLDAEAHARQPLGAQTNLCLCAKGTARLQFDRARTTASLARR
jgi:hypothetical protein